MAAKLYTPSMAEPAPPKRKRYFVRLTDEAKRRLDFLAVDAGAASTEEFGGNLLTEVIDRLWRDFDPKRGEQPADPAGKPRKPRS